MKMMMIWMLVIYEDEYEDEVEDEDDDDDEDEDDGHVPAGLGGFWMGIPDAQSHPDSIT